MSDVEARRLTDPKEFLDSLPLYDLSTPYVDPIFGLSNCTTAANTSTADAPDINAMIKLAEDFRRELREWRKRMGELAQGLHCPLCKRAAIYRDDVLYLCAHWYKRLQAESKAAAQSDGPFGFGIPPINSIAGIAIGRMEAIDEPALSSLPAVCPGRSRPGIPQLDHRPDHPGDSAGRSLPNG